MPITVSGPDGAEIEFPDDTSPDTIKSVMAKHYGAPEAQPQARTESVKASPQAMEEASFDVLKRDFNKAMKAGDTESAKAISEAVRGKMAKISPAFQSDRATMDLGALAKGSERIAGTIGNVFGGDYQDPVRAGEVADLGEGFVRSVTAPLGGDYIAAAGSALTGKGYNPDEQRARRQELAEKAPITAAAAEALGAGGVGKVLAPARGGLVAQGAATGAVTGSNLSGGDLGETAKGAAFGAAGGKLAEKIGEAFDPMKALAARVKGADGKPIKPQELYQTFKEVEAATGQKPSMVDLLNAHSQKTLARVAESQPKAAAVFEDAQKASAAALPGKLEAQVRRGGRTVAAGEVTAREEAMGGSRVDAAQAATKAELDAARQEARGQLQTVKTQTQETIAAQQGRAEQARQAIQREIGQVTDAGDIAGVQRATAIRDQWANEAMDALERQPILVGRDLTRGPLRSQGVLDALNGELRYATPGSATAARLDRLITNIQEGRAAFITVRDIDTIRRSLNRAIESGAVTKQVLREVVGPIEARARAASPAYRQFLDDYAAQSREIEGFTHGTGVTTPAGSTEFSQTIQDNPGAFTSGAERGARVTLSDAARRAPEATARKIVADPSKVRAALGGRAEGVVRSAAEGTRAIDEAYAAAREAGLRGRAAADSIRERLRAAGVDIKARGSASVEAIRREVASKVEDVNRASKVLTSDTDEFVNAFNNANKVTDDVKAVVRGRVASTAGESERSALSTAQKLTDPGVQARLSATLGEGEAANLRVAGETAKRSAENYSAITKKAAGGPIEPADAKKMASLGATAIAKTKSPGLIVPGIDAALKSLKRLGMAPGVSKKLAELAVKPGGPEELLDFLIRSQVSGDAIAKIGQVLGIELGTH